MHFFFKLFLEVNYFYLKYKCRVQMEIIGNFEACRLCSNCYVNNQVEFIHLYQPIGDLQLQQELNFITSELRAWQLNISHDDGLPQRICANCFAKFCGIDAFRLECEEAQKKLLESFTPQHQLSEAQQQNLQINNIGNDKTLTATEYLAANGDALTTVKSEVVIVTNQIQQKIEQNVNTIPMQLSTYFTSEGTTPVEHEVIAGIAPTEINAVQPNLENYDMYQQSFTNLQNTALLQAESTLLNDALVDVEAPDLYFTARHIPEIAFAKEADSIVQSKTIEAEMENIVAQDLEEMLQGNLIPTKANNSMKNNLTNGVVENKIKENHVDIEKTKYDYENATCVDQEYEEDEDEEFDDVDEFDTTISKRISGNPFACQYCYCPLTGNIDHLIFPNSEELSQHFFDVHDPKLPYTCPYCPQKYISAESRDNHVIIMHTANITVECEYCHKQLRGPMELHQNSCQFVGDWECGTCSKKFTQMALHRFRVHQRLHETNKKLCCVICERSFVRRANLEAHERLHGSGTIISCDQCKRVFPGDYELKRHKYQAHNGELPMKCEFCNKGFVTLAFVNRHKKHFHAEKINPKTSDSIIPDIINKCTNCGTSFNSLHKLRYHLQRSRDEHGKCINAPVLFNEKRRQTPRQGIYPCPHCSKRFHVKSQLEKHLNTHDARLRPFQCDQCHIRARTAFELKQHVQVVHLNIKSFACEKCDKRFGYKKDLTQHMLSHAELNVYCEEPDCDYVCKNDKVLNDHIRHKHRLISCEYCGESYTHQRLTTHLRKAHRTEIDVEISTDSFNAAQILVNNNEKVRVELIHSNNDPVNSLVALQEQSSNHNAATAYNVLPPFVPGEELENFLATNSIMDEIENGRNCSSNI